jgi:GT2 family glycosyltransferase
MTEREQKPLVSVVIPTFNRAYDLSECLDSVIRSDYPNMEIVVVDNNCTDGTFELVRQRFPMARLVRSLENRGAAGGRNLGLQNARGTFVFFLDHDTVVAKDTISILVGVLARYPDIGLAGPTVYYYSHPSRVWAQGTAIDLITGLNVPNAFANRQVLDKRPLDVQILPTAMLVLRTVALSVGGFDEALFACYEDSDFSFALRRAGYRVTCVRSARVWTKEQVDAIGATPKLLSRAGLIARNRTIFMRRYAKASGLLLYLLVTLPALFLWYAGWAVASGQPAAVRRYAQGLLEGLVYKSVRNGR